MAVHIPLSVEAQSEARMLMLASNNILLPASGKPTVTPTQDMILGIYYLTVERPNPEDSAKCKGSGMNFYNFNDARAAYEADILHLHAKINVRDEEGKRINTTVGRIIFNQTIKDITG